MRSTMLMSVLLVVGILVSVGANTQGESANTKHHLIQGIDVLLQTGADASSVQPGDAAQFFDRPNQTAAVLGKSESVDLSKVAHKIYNTEVLEFDSNDDTLDEISSHITTRMGHPKLINPVGYELAGSGVQCDGSATETLTKTPKACADTCPAGSYFSFNTRGTGEEKSCKCYSECSQTPQATMDVFKRVEYAYNYTRISACGNGVRDEDEECDDGNVMSGDGCSTTCTVEGGYACYAKSLLDTSGSCKQCTKDECTVFYNGAWHCMPTTPRDVDGKSVDSLFVRDPRGFCMCGKSTCMVGSVCKATGEGVFKEADGTCGCGEGYCLMPMAKGHNVGPTNHTCMKLQDDYIRLADGTCGCIGYKPAVFSTDPSVARKGIQGACKAYPSSPVEKVPHGDDRFGLFECHRDPYTQPHPSGITKVANDTKCDAVETDGSTQASLEDCGNSCGTDYFLYGKGSECSTAGCQCFCQHVSNGTCSQVPRANFDLHLKGGWCEGCAEGSCKIQREVGSGRPGSFSCLDNETMAAEGYQLNTTDGSCLCEEGSCLVPRGDGFVCKPLDSSFPYGGVVTSAGKCGCAFDRSSCIMPTKRAGDGTITDFVCLDLGTDQNKTDYGEKFRRSKDGHCVCKDSHCIADPDGQSVGTFDCIDTVKDTTYKKSTAPGREGKCECQGQCRFSGEAHETAACATCPTQAGNCVSKCIGGPGMKKKECLKYCVTKHLKFSLPPGRSYSEMLPKKEMLARAVECFVWKNVTCTHSPNDQTSKGWWCLQTINSKILLNCPARWSPHAARLLPDGTESFGFQSICEKDDIECIVQNCDRSATSGMCMDKLVSV